MRRGVAQHFGWAVAVTAAADHHVVDRRRIDLVEPGVSTAAIHYEGRGLDDAAVAELVARVRASARRATTAALSDLAAAVPEPIASMSLRRWPPDFPEDVAVQRRAPHEGRADSVRYLPERFRLVGPAQIANRRLAGESTIRIVDAMRTVARSQR